MREYCFVARFRRTAYNHSTFVAGERDGHAGQDRRDALRTGESRSQGEHRTIAGQIEYWAAVGRAALDNPDLPASFIAESLASMREPRDQATPFVPRTRGK